MGNDDFIYGDLTYAVNGILFDTHNERGRYCHEKQYCDTIEAKLKEKGIAYEREKILPKSFEVEKKGRHRVDFLIENKLVVEAKVVRALSRDDYYQTQRYLKALNKKLALLVNFRNKRLRIKRIINPDAKEESA